MRIPHAPRSGSTIQGPDYHDHNAHWHVHSPQVDWGHVAAGMAALVIAVVVMWFFYQP